MSKYTKEYFIEKFSAIPEEEIGRHSLNNHCSLYHCGVRAYYPTEESKALSTLLYPVAKKINPVLSEEDLDNIFIINDLPDNAPKQNILNALNSLE